MPRTMMIAHLLDVEDWYAEITGLRHLILTFDNDEAGKMACEAFRNWAGHGSRISGKNGEPAVLIKGQPLDYIKDLSPMEINELLHEILHGIRPEFVYGDGFDMFHDIYDDFKD